MLLCLFHGLDVGAKAAVQQWQQKEKQKSKFCFRKANFTFEKQNLLLLFEI
jgi:hypothetical protein